MRTWALLLIPLALGCEREKRDFQTEPPGALSPPLVTMNPNQAGVRTVPVTAASRYDDNAWAISEGQRLYNWFNCVGCHAHGGGGMGPALMDDQWIYGSEPENIYASIVQGRPNGMPVFGGRLNSQQVWQLVAYVRTLAGLTRIDARSARADEMSSTQPATLQENTPKPKQSTEVLPPPPGD